jgi:hypothetical protein
MPLILAIEPDRHQAAHLKSIVRTSLNAELVLGDTVGHALSALGDRVPDLVLTPPLLSPKDERALDLKLRSMDAAEHVQTLTIPVLGVPEARKPAGVLSKLRRGRKKKAAPEGCDPAVFAEQCAVYLERAKIERAAGQEAEQHVALPHVEQMEATAASGSGEPIASEPVTEGPLAPPSRVPETSTLENRKKSSKKVAPQREVTPGAQKVVEPPATNDLMVSIIAESAPPLVPDRPTSDEAGQALDADAHGADVQPVERFDSVIAATVAVMTEPLGPVGVTATDAPRDASEAHSPALDAVSAEVIDPVARVADATEPTPGELVADPATAAAADTAEDAVTPIRRTVDVPPADAPRDASEAHSPALDAVSAEVMDPVARVADATEPTPGELVADPATAAAADTAEDTVTPIRRTVDVSAADAPRDASDVHSPALDAISAEVMDPVGVADATEPTPGELVADLATAAAADPAEDGATPIEPAASSPANGIGVSLEFLGASEAHFELPDVDAAPTEAEVLRSSPEPSLAALVAGLIDPAMAVLHDGQLEVAGGPDDPARSAEPFDEMAAAQTQVSAELRGPLESISPEPALEFSETPGLPGRDHTARTAELSLAAAVAELVDADVAASSLDKPASRTDEPAASGIPFEKTAPVSAQITAAPGETVDTVPSGLAGNVFNQASSGDTSATSATEGFPIAADAPQSIATAEPASGATPAATDPSEEAGASVEPPVLLAEDVVRASTESFKTIGTDGGESPDIHAVITSHSEGDAPPSAEPSLAALVAGLIDNTRAVPGEEQAATADVPDEPVRSYQPDKAEAASDQASEIPAPIATGSSDEGQDIGDTAGDAAPPGAPMPPLPASHPSLSSTMPMWLGPAHLWPAIGGVPIDDDSRGLSLEERIRRAGLGRALEQGRFDVPDPIQKTTREAPDPADQRRRVRQRRSMDVDAYEINVDELLAGGDAQVASLLSFASVRGGSNQTPRPPDFTPVVSSGEKPSEPTTTPGGMSMSSPDGDLLKAGSPPASAAGITIDPDLWNSPQPAAGQNSPRDIGAGQQAVPIELLLASSGKEADAPSPVPAVAPPPSIPQAEPVKENPVRARALAKRAAKAAAAAAKAGAKRKRKAKQATNVSDEWGFFDPAQCGFAALVSKLDEITGEPDDSIDSDG